jgi:hypothetical protein
MYVQYQQELLLAEQTRETHANSRLYVLAYNTVRSAYTGISSRLVALKRGPWVMDA